MAGIEGVRMPRSRSHRLSAAAAGALALTLALTACGPAEEPEIPRYTPPVIEGSLPGDLTAQLHAAVEHAMEAAGAPGAIVGVWVPGSGVWTAGIGTQGADSSTVVTPDMAFRIGDVTRLMTCDVLDGLERDGLLPARAVAAQYLSSAPNLMDVTLRDLCNGTAGVGSFEPALRDVFHRMPEREWSPQELASYGLGQPRSEVGAVYRSSDTSYVLLGLALERASGMSASQLIDRYVTTPLGLESTSLPRAAAAAPGEPAMHGYFLPQAGDGFICSAPVEVTTLSSSVGFTDSGVVSTIDDLGRYVQAVAAQVLAGGAQSSRFADPRALSDDNEGWRQATGGAHLVGPLIGQYGAIPGYATAAFSDPATGFTVAVVLNDSTDGGMIAAYLAWELAAIVSTASVGSQFALPFTAEGMHEAIAYRALTCVEPELEPTEPEETEG